jgi:hypothetical protein
MANPVNDNKEESTEQYIKDVRSTDSTKNEPVPTPEDVKESGQNEHAQEENKKSQMNAELDSKFGDCSDPEKSKINNAGRPKNI